MGQGTCVKCGHQFFADDSEDDTCQPCIDNPQPEIKKNSVVLINFRVQHMRDNPLHHQLMIVSSVEGWGLKGYVKAPEGNYPMRLQDGDYIYIGQIPDSVELEDF